MSDHITPRPIHITIPLTTITDTFYMVLCRDCGGEHGRKLPIPFDTESDRDEWCTAHTKATGHRVDRHIELHGRDEG